ncbi:prephenate/arogenate dehydrogenase family protein [Altererythrobacter sp. MF3-039]|uniref:prephenate/arogenate dehydrogenase family protein n=1 Tax=Altererythrobacter sp. MF3-039 TaxID=3252901 RepID=UPI00390CCC83
MTIKRVAIVGLGLLGGSLGLALKEYCPDIVTTGYDSDPETRRRAAERGLAGTICESASGAVAEADLVVMCVPVGAMGAVATEIADALPRQAIVSDVGSSKASIHAAISAALPEHIVIPAHPVAGTEQSGPDAGFASLFQHRWCILTPPDDVPEEAVAALRTLWEALGAEVEIMSAEHHDLVLAVTSHLPHLIAYTIVGTASDLEDVTRGEVIKYSAGGFRDFTRIAASDPTMWRDVFLSNKDAVLEMLQVFSEDLTRLQRAIRRDDGDALFELFSKTRAIRRGIIEMGQDDARPDFGRSDHEG